MGPTNEAFAPLRVSLQGEGGICHSRERTQRDLSRRRQLDVHLSPPSVDARVALIKYLPRCNMAYALCDSTVRVGGGGHLVGCSCSGSRALSPDQ